VSVDAWLSIIVEFSLSLRELIDTYGSADDTMRSLVTAEVNAYPVELAWLPDWRTWQASLSHVDGPTSDELPEVVLPQRLLVRTGGVIDVALALENSSDWPLARACELAACGRGQTLEAFVLSAASRSHSGMAS
jgi:hypothetical protein